MQHSIFLRSGNGLLKRYLDLDGDKDYEITEIKNVVWIDGVHLVRCVLQLKIGFPLYALKCMCNKSLSVTICPPVCVAVLVLARLLLKKISPALYSRLAVVNGER
jgi:hypothetical protein